MARNNYEDNLKRRQDEHLKRVRERHDIAWQPCAHDNCSQCCGTGIKLDGSPCVHHLVCHCPKCSPRFTSKGGA